MLNQFILRKHQEQNLCSVYTADIQGKCPTRDLEVTNRSCLSHKKFQKQVKQGLECKENASQIILEEKEKFSRIKVFRPDREVLVIEAENEDEFESNCYEESDGYF